MKSLPEYCDSCEQMCRVGSNVFVRMTGEIKEVGNVTFKESICGVWCEGCYMIAVPEEPFPQNA